MMIQLLLSSTMLFLFCFVSYFISWFVYNISHISHAYTTIHASHGILFLAVCILPTIKGNARAQMTLHQTRHQITQGRRSMYKQLGSFFSTGF